MIKKPIDVLANYEIRKSKKQKTAFIEAVAAYANENGYSAKIEKDKFGSRNIVIGDSERAEFLVTAHYDTCASIGIPNFITPCNPVGFLLCQIFVFALFFAAAFLVALVVSVLSHNSQLTLWSAYITCFGMMLLMMFGPANRHTANDNTSGVVTLLEIMSALPENLRDRVCFVLFDLEEAGIIGSSSYRKAHKAAAQRQIVLNLDCVGDGDEIVLFPMKKLKKDAQKLSDLEKICGTYGKKTISLRKKGFSYYPSDQKHFPYGVGVAAFRRAKFVGLYCARIHTWRDTVLEHSNISILRDTLISYIKGSSR